MNIIHLAAFILGILINLAAMRSVIRTLVLPRSAPDPITRFTFLTIRRFFDLRLRWTQEYTKRDRVMSYYAPVGLMILPMVWLGVVLIGFMFMFWASGIESWQQALTATMQLPRRVG